uniref:Matrix remodeling associated 5 n=1 Tax=Otolemur garnettii TaxID=30611 RepID=H0XMI3_OTOGA
MRAQAPWGALSVVLMLLWGHPRAALACPHPCACYVPSEVHCTFRSLASVPAGISKHVERMNLGFNSIQALSQTSFAGLTKLELLMIHGNEIPDIPDGALRDLASLQVNPGAIMNTVQFKTAYSLKLHTNFIITIYITRGKIHYHHGLQLFYFILFLQFLARVGFEPATSGIWGWHPTNLSHRHRPWVAIINNHSPVMSTLALQLFDLQCFCLLICLIGILKCKKDKAYEGGQLCAMCASPRKLFKQEIHKLKDVACLKPSIESPLRQNTSRGLEEEQEQEEDGDSQLVPEGFQFPRWNISLNMTDEHGNMVNLVCAIKKPTDLYKIHLNQTDPPDIEINATVALDFECPMTRENYEKLWKLIAYYSEVPVKLRRELMLSKDPKVSYQYRQDADDDALYYTGVKAQILAEPEWVAQPYIDLQLNRRQSTARKVLLSYYAQHSLTMSAKDTMQARASWVMIEPSTAVQRAQTVLEGASCQLSCNVKASDSPSIFWILPDGSVLKAPMDDQDNKFSVLSSGWLRIKSMQQSDSGLYQCIAQVRDEMDQMVYRVLVQPPSTQPHERDTVIIEKNPGELVLLPCSALAIPEAHLSWILPNKRIIHDSANTSHAYMLPNGALSIPTVQVSDSGYYRCVAINQQGADHFTVGVTVSKKGSGRSSKRGRRPGAKGLSRVREDVVEDEGASGMGDEDTTSRKALHPKDQEMFLKTKDEGTVGDKKVKKGRRKLKLWKNSEKEPETNVAEGRRVFESRRRINMANKQINPERWADILARVRGKNLPKGTEEPLVIRTTTPPSMSPEETPLSPAVSPLSSSPVQTANSVKESSADMSLFGEEEQVWTTFSSPRMGLEHHHNGDIIADPEVTSTQMEEVTDDASSEKTEEVSPTEVDIKWITDSTLITEPYESSPALDTVYREPTLDTVYKESTNEETTTGGWTTANVGSMVDPTSDDYEPPLSAISLAELGTMQSFYPDLETNSQPGEDKMRELTFASFTPTPTVWVTDLITMDSFEDSTLGGLDTAARSHQQGLIDDIQLVESGFITQDTQLITKTPWGGDTLEGDLTNSRSSQSEGQDITSITLPKSAVGVNNMSSINHPGETTLGTVLHRDTSTASMVTPRPNASLAMPTHSSQRKHNGRRRLRPHQSRHRHKQTPPTTSAPMETFSTQPTRVPEIKTPYQMESSLLPTSWVDSTVHLPKQMEIDRNTESVSKRTPRRKHKKRPHKQHYITSTMSSRESTSTPSPSPENKSKNVITPTLESRPWSRTVALKMGDSYEAPRVDNYMTTTTKIHPSHHDTQETLPTTYKPMLDKKEIRDDDVTDIKDTSVPGELVINVMSTSGSLVSSVGEVKEDSSTKDFSDTPSTGHPPRTGQAGKLQTDTPVTNFVDNLPDAPHLRELENEDVTAVPSSPSVKASTTFQQEALGHLTTLASLTVELPSGQTETTNQGQEHGETTVAVIHSETKPQNAIPAFAPVEEQASPSPPTTLVSLTQTTPSPALISSRRSPTSIFSEGNVFLNYVGNPETKAPSDSTQGTQAISSPNELSTTSSNQVTSKLSPKQDLGKELFGSRGNNSLPGIPDSLHQDGGVRISSQPSRVPSEPPPPRGTLRPPDMSTKSFFKYFATFQPSHHLTNRPLVTVSPSRALPENKLFTTPKLSTTTATPISLHVSKPTISSKLTEQRTDRFNAYSKAFGNNNLPEPRHPIGRLPNSRVPPYSNGRLPFYINRTFSFSQLGVTLKPQTSSSPIPVMRERIVNPSPYNRIHSQSTFHLDFGPPAPPLLHPPRTTTSPSANSHLIMLVSPTRSSVSFATSSVQSPGSSHQSIMKLFAGGPPASKFRTPGEKPQIITKFPQTVSITAETDAVFPCEATGKPTPFITWTKVSTGVLITPSTRVQRFEVLKNGTLVIRRVQVQDRGQYVCTASNLHGLDRLAVLLAVTVQQPQILASHYQDVTVYLGDTIAMECLAKGTPAPQISWVFPDRTVWHTVSRVEGRITLHENRTLSIKEASFSDRGVYKCVASNAAGADSLAIRLHVAALPPVIQQDKLENISLPPGLSIHIHCSAKAAPLPSVRWVLWDGTQIRPSQFLRGNLFVFPNGTLYIRNLAPKDSGRYECVAANLVGSARRTVLLTVHRTAANARITGTSPQRTDVRYGGTLRLDCSASGDPWPRILWRLPSKRMMDTLLSFDSRVKVFANGTLVVKSVTEKDAGDYLCVARNKVGDDYVVLKVNVVMKPAKIEHKENDHKVFYGGDLKVDCVATGLPNPEISWSLPDGSLVNSFMQSDDSGARTKRYVVFNNGTLYFNEVGMREEGDYTCFAENQVGKDEMRVRVKVVAEPAAILNKTYLVVRVPYGEVVTIPCDAKGEPLPKVTWLSPTNRLMPTSSEKYQIYQDGTLLIQKAQRSDSGNYTCVVRNSAGEDRKTVWIHVTVQPPKINGKADALTTVREIAAVGSRKLVPCQAEGVPAPRVLWAFPEGVILPAPYFGNRVTVHRNGTLDIKTLRKTDSVQLVCIARNEGGEARMVVQLTVLEPMHKPVFHDPVSEKITATAGHTISLNCSAAGTPLPSLSWVLPNGTELLSGRQLQRFYHKEDGMLHISDLSSVDAGAYRCVARNAAGHAERLVSLKVGLKPEVSNPHHNLVSIINGDTLHLQCVPPGDSRRGRFSWTLPNGVVLESPHVLGRFSAWDNGTLTVREASVFDRGTYTCRVETEHGPTVTSIPVIVIAYPPRITSEPTPVVYARPGNTVKLNCMAVGIPKAEITWELPDKSHLTAGAHARLYGNRFLQPQGALTIQLATQRDAGFYKCTAKNVLGSDSKTTYIHVL